MDIIKTLASADETTAIAEDFAKHLSAGDCVCLSGPVGAGKTHFARTIIQTILAMDRPVEDVPSPTFTLVQVYDTAKGEIWHTDLYRLSSFDELIELGLDDAFETAITLVEWPDRLGEATPARRIELDFAPVDATADGRKLTIRAFGDNWGWLADV